MEDVGKYIWIEDDNYMWIPAKIADFLDNKYKFIFKIDGEEIIKYEPRDKENEYSEVHTSCLQGIDDLLWLGDFNQQTLLHNTRERFAQNKIYSFIGMPILIAVNPYKHLNIYTQENITHYKNYFFQLKRNPNELPPPIPHLYHIAEAAYQDMINEKKNQSIVISGESGSGKTQSTKIILKYLAVSSLHGGEGLLNNNNSNNTVEKQVLDSNPLLEAFGNAKTVRNNNSSRFGKFIQVNFTEHGKIISARIYNYLLEKSRVVSIQPEERNYHIFYQLILGADNEERKKHHIKSLEYYNFLNKGCFEVDETDDKENFKETIQCMLKLNFKKEEINYIFDVIMGILYLGNVEFSEVLKNGNIAANIADASQNDFKLASELLGISEEKFKNILTTRNMKDPMSGASLQRNLTIEKAYNCRDATAKAVYARMFDYIVYKVNSAIANRDELNKHEKDKIRKIGLLDIFGFENFENNSFEQLCINYANERLQQFFNNHIFKIEQEEYKKEGIDWSQVEFTDNKEIIELIDENKMSIFAILDSEGITPNANDETFRNKIYHHLSKNYSLGDNTEDYISVNHYAGMVYYYVWGFIEKNLDQLTPDILEALEKSKNRLIRKVFGKKEDEDKGMSKNKKPNAPNKLQSDSLSKQFKKQLDELMKMLTQSNPRYVKCIKPNSVKKPLIIESHDVMEQLLSAGVLEAIKIRKQGYSIRRSQEEFVRRYHPLTPHINLNECEEKKDFSEGTKQMVQQLQQVPDIKPFFDPQKKLIQFGITKIFMKEEVKNILESKLNRIKYILRIQTNFRSWKVKIYVRNYLNSVKKIQARWRGIEARIFLLLLRVTIRLQRFVRFIHKRRKIFKHLHELAIENIKQKEILRLELERQKEEERLKEIEAAAAAMKYHSQSQSKDKDKENHASCSNNQLLIVNTNDIQNINSNSISDISATEILNELAGGLASGNAISQAYKRNNPKKNTSKNIFSDLLQSNLDSAHEEMRLRLEILTEELLHIKKEKEGLASELKTSKDETKRKEKELEILKSNADTNSLKAQLDNFTSNIDKFGADINSTKKSLNTEYIQPCDHLDELRRLKKEVAEKEGLMDVLNLKIDELSKTNVDLVSLNESLKLQVQNRTEKMNKELSNLYQQMKDLEIKKNEVERVNKSLVERENTNSTLIEDQKINTSINITNDNKELKLENKQLNKKIEEIKSKYEKDIQNLRNELFIKDNRLKEVEIISLRVEKELIEKSESYSNVKMEYDLCKEKIQEMKLKLENLNKNSKLQEYEQEINKMKTDFETGVKKKDLELQELRDSIEMSALQVDRLKKMEKALRNELNSKNEELNRRQEMLREARLENDKLMDDNILIQKENFNLTSKLEVLQVESTGKHEHENKLKNNEIKILKEKEKKYEKIISEMKESLNKKQRIIDTKKKMNLMLVDLAKIKKGEVQCLETLNYTNSNTLRDTLLKIRENEKDLLSRLGEISAGPDNTDSEEDDNSDGSDFEEYDD